jgi:hypothetical protein
VEGPGEREHPCSGAPRAIAASWLISAGLACLLASVATAAAPPVSPQVYLPGKRPGYTQRQLSNVPNEVAMRRRLWSPGLDDGYVPQGVTFAEGRLLVATYHSTDPNTSRGPCRIYHVDRNTGAVVAYFDGPSACGHAGGIEYAANGILYLGDDKQLFRIDLDRALADGDTHAAVLNTFTLRGGLRADYLAFDGEALWMGPYSSKPVQMHAIPERALSQRGASQSLSEADAVSSIPVTARMQGAARDRAGFLWLTQSGGRFGHLQKADANTGSIIAEYEMPAGIEDIAFDGDDRLWAVSEAGSLRWLAWSTFFPVIFELDPAALR